MSTASTGAALSALLLALAGCAPILPRATAPLPGAAYFPLRPGNWWLYDVEDRTFGWRFRRRVEITRLEVVSDVGHELAILEETWTSGRDPVFRAPVQPIGLYWDEGYLHWLHLTERDGRLDAFEALEAVRILPESLRVPMTWSGSRPDERVPSEIRFRLDRKHEIRRREMRVKVPAGRFRAIRVDTTEVHRGSAPRADLHDVRFYYSDWYAAGVGPVRSETWDDAGRTKLRVRVELLDFGIGPP